MKACKHTVSWPGGLGMIAWAISAGAGDLEATLAFEPKAESHYVAVTNRSPQFLCVAERVFDTQRGYLSLATGEGERVEQRSHADGAPNPYRGMDLASSYLFLRPGEHRKIYIDLGNFMTKQGTYEYTLLFPYYVCRDIIDVTPAVKQQDIPTKAVQAKGSITLPR